MARRHLQPIEERPFYGNKYSAAKKMSDSEQADFLISLLDAGNWHEYWNYRRVITGRSGEVAATAVS